MYLLRITWKKWMESNNSYQTIKNTVKVQVLPDLIESRMKIKYNLPLEI